MFPFFQDRYVVMENLNEAITDGAPTGQAQAQAYFAVFDGHGGAQAAQHAATFLHYHLVHAPWFNEPGGLAKSLM